MVATPRAPASGTHLRALLHDLADALANALANEADREPPPPADRHVPLTARGAAREGFQLRGLKALVKSGKLPSFKVGQHRFVLYSDLLKLAKAERAPAVVKAPAADPLGEMIAARAARARKAG